MTNSIARTLGRYVSICDSTRNLTKRIALAKIRRASSFCSSLEISLHSTESSSFLSGSFSFPRRFGRPNELKVSCLARYFRTMSRDRPFTVVVEGNIGSGKTTLLQYFAESPIVETFQEPVNKWRDVRGHNTLGLMYEDPRRWSLTFQTYVQLTMLDLHSRRLSRPGATVKMMERSIYSAKHCFVENLRSGGVMPPVEYAVLTEWFDWILANQDCGVDLIVYLKTNPENVHERIKRRCRDEEKAIPLDYLQTLHDLHERWLLGTADGPAASGVPSPPAPVLTLDGNSSTEDMIKKYESNREEILGKKPIKGKEARESMNDSQSEFSLNREAEEIDSTNAKKKVLTAVN